MQTPISSRHGSVEVPQKASPATPRTRKLKSPGSTASSPSPTTKTLKDRSPKVVVERKSPRIPITEKRGSKVCELEAQIGELEEELKKAKEELRSSQWWKKRAEHEAEEAKKQLGAISAKLDDSQKQLNELYESEESRIQELRKISQDRDRAWQSELEAVQKQYSMDSASAMHEMQKLKLQLDRVSQSGDAEIQRLRVELGEALDSVERLKQQLNESREYEAECDSVKESLIVDLEHSKKRVKSLEETVARLQSVCEKSSENGDCHEVDQLRSSLEDAERRYRDEYNQSTMQIRKLVELAKSESTLREAELHEKLKEVDELRTKLAESAALEDLQSKCEIMSREKLTESCKKVARVTEELDAAQASNTQLETELRRLKVQCDQWRKAAEAAAAMLERTGSFYAKKLTSSPHSDHTDDDDDNDDSPKKKNGNINMLKKIGVLLKKAPK